MVERRIKALRAAREAYWLAQNHAEEHAAVQRLIALGVGNEEWKPCSEPECVRLRNLEIEFLRGAA